MIKTLTGAARGVAAGAVGTLAMDLVWYRRYRDSGGDGSFLAWDISKAESFEEAGAPAQVGKLVSEGVLHKEIPDEAAGRTTNVVHWATGTQWGALYGATASALGTASPAMGVVLGPLAWGAAYVVLPAMGVYQPIWEYDAKTLAKDLSAHMVFGLATAVAYRFLTRP